MTTETAQLVATIKRLLRKQNVTYRVLAEYLKLSEPSIKRLFSSGRFTVERLEQVSHLLGYTLAELTREAIATQIRLNTLTRKQEQELVSDPKLLLVAVCALNNWNVHEIIEYYLITENECVKHLLRLDKLRVIDLLPGNRIRVNVSRDFDWLPGGPISEYFKVNGQKEFMQGTFDREDESRVFVHGMLTDQARAQLLDELRRLRQRMLTLHEESLVAPLSKRYGVGLMFALRAWEPADFAKLRR